MINSINEFLFGLDSLLGSAFWFPYFLVGIGIFFTVYLKFPQVKYFKRGFRILLNNKSDATAKGETSPFQALSMVLSGTVGTGNIAGVALAIYLGGPAALFWMWVTAFVGMATKMVEVTMSHKYREVTSSGSIAGGPMYFMDKRLNWKPVAIIFAIATVFCSFGTGSLPQVNTIAVSVNSSFGIDQMLTGGVLALLLGAVIIGGISRISYFASRIMPTMAIFYLVGALGVLIANYQNIVPAFISIFTNLFTGSAATGGFLGASIAYAFNRGVNRGLYSNEAGQGSAPIALSSSQTKEPVEAGLVSLMSPFIDTIVICTITGLVILASGVWTEKHSNQFQATDFLVVNEQFTHSNPEDTERLFKYYNRQVEDNPVSLYDGSLFVTDGKVDSTANVTMLHARTIAEQVTITEIANSNPYTGIIEVKQGKFDFSIYQVTGKSLLHSVNLTSKAFTKSIFGDFGMYFVTISILLFAFSTAIAWSYIGDRAVTYLFGERGVLPYRIIYVLAFFIASFQDTTLIWNFSLITIVLMTIPNLISLVYNYKELKPTLKDYISRH